MKTITWDGVSSSTVPGLGIGPVTRDVIGARRGAQLDVPGRPGFIHFPQPAGRREITAECFIEGDTFQERRDRFEALADWLDVADEAQLIISDMTGCFYLGILAQAPSAEEWRNVGTFELVWQIQPYAYDSTPSVETYTAGASNTHTWASGVKVTTYPVIQITPTDGTLLGCSVVTNGIGGMTFVGSIDSGATLTINSLSAVVLEGVSEDSMLVGAYDPSRLVMAGVSGTFPELYAGIANILTFTKNAGTATSFDISITYRKTSRK